MVKNRPLVVDRATVFEWPQIEALRVAYFEAWDQPVQRRSTNTVWYIARIGERVVGTFSTEMSSGQLWALDFYVVSGRDGVLAAGAMYKALYALADAEDVDLVCCVNPSNLRQLEATVAHGFDPIGVLLLRKPGKGRRCHLPPL